MPDEITRRDIQEIGRGIKLLDGKKSRGTWSNVVVDTAPGTGRSILDTAQGTDGALLEITAPLEIKISDHILNLGTATYALKAIVDTVTEGDEGDQIRFIPAADNNAEVSLMSPSRSIDSSMTQPPVELLRQHAGKWIAHAGARILASGPTPAVVAAALREWESAEPFGAYPAQQLKLNSTRWASDACISFRISSCLPRKPTDRWST